MFRSVLTGLGLCAAALSLTACQVSKSSNPLSPTVAGPIPGVNITAPKPVDPTVGSRIAVDSQPLTLTVENASTSGVRPLSYLFEVATDSSFNNKVFTRDGITPGDGGRTAIKLPEALATGRTYYWRVRAQDGANTGSYSTPVNFNVFTPIVINAPVPQAPAREFFAQQNYREKNGACLLCDYVEIEREEKARVVCENDGFLAVVPFWAVWPFEILVCSRRHFGSFTEFQAGEVTQLSALLKRITSTYDRVFDVPFPYSMGFHQHPFDEESHPEWHFHAHFYPPLLRSATIRKFMVGFELLGGPQRDITAESAAEVLRQAALR